MNFFHESLISNNKDLLQVPVTTEINTQVIKVEMQCRRGKEVGFERDRDNGRNYSTVMI